MELNANPSAMENILEVQHVCKAFHPPASYADLLTLRFRNLSPVVALNNISFCVKKGQIVGILGPNGAGKTTLLKIIATLILADTGSIKVKNLMAGKDDQEIKSLIGLMTSQERSFYCNMVDGWLIAISPKDKRYKTRYFGIKTKH